MRLIDFEGKTFHFLKAGLDDFGVDSLEMEQRLRQASSKQSLQSSAGLIGCLHDIFDSMNAMYEIPSAASGGDPCVGEHRNCLLHNAKVLVG